jgi:hypothetical protein
MIGRGQPLEREAVVKEELDSVMAHLTSHLRGRLHDVSVSVHRDGVVIRGKAGSYYVKQLAQHAVMEAVSLPIAANEIEVSPPHGARGR